MTGRLNKALWILKNEGPLVLGKKGARVLVRKTGAKLPAQPSEQYSYLANPLFQITTEQIQASQGAAKAPLKEIKSAVWFVPYFDHITYGGIYTIFRFIEYIAQQDVSTTIAIFDNKYLDTDAAKAEIAKHFPGLKNINLVALDLENKGIESLPASDIAFSTIWMSAYVLLKYNQTKRKYYFVQDYEPLFYEGGSTYALAESTYRFGFTGVVNTPGLLQAVNQRHGMAGVSFTPAVDKRYYYPLTREPNKRVRIFFYARPNNPRNAFELGILIIQDLIRRYGDKIEIITAGADWNEADYGLKGLITNNGLLHSLDEVGGLYKTCDIGFVFMLSKHPSYQPFEFMACGMATVTNRNEDNLWFFKDGENCLLAEPSATAMAEKIGTLVEDEPLRRKIAKNGEKSVSFNWQPELQKIWEYIKQDTS
jgi:O-antigen biosynthesis protein